MRRVPDSDPVTRLRWRAGNWPGHLEIQMGSGRIVRTPKVYYNFLIPFFVTQASLQSMDFANEFADLAVGDAWSPAHEAAGGGHSVFVTRSPEMETIIRELIERGLLTAVEEDPMQASAMHGHMLDFKKRGGYIRNQWRRFCGLRAPDFGYRPARIALPRYFVEIIVSSLFLAGRLRLARWALTRLPEEWLGRVFNRMRLLWKSLSKPAKRKGLANYKVDINGVS
jgi:coenzyme F420 hydrogenase subunit beta